MKTLMVKTANGSRPGAHDLCPAFIVLAVCLAGTAATAQIAIPATYAVPSAAADPTKRGFVWRIHQVATGQVNSNARTEQQLAGQLGDNIADPFNQGIALAPANPPNPATAPITFEIGTVINLSVQGWEAAGNFTPDDALPGLPGTRGGRENAAAEIRTWLDLPTGTVTLGVNSDDGFRIDIGGANPSDPFATTVGEFDGGRGASDTVFSFDVPQAGQGRRIKTLRWSTRQNFPCTFA